MSDRSEETARSRSRSAATPTAVLWGVGADAVAHGLGAVAAGWAVVGVADEAVERAELAADALGCRSVPLDELRASGPAALGLTRPPHVVVLGATGQRATDDLVTLTAAGATVVVTTSLTGDHSRPDAVAARLSGVSGQVVHGDPTPYAPAISAAMRVIEGGPPPQLVEVRHVRPERTSDDGIDPLVRGVALAMVLARVAGAGTVVPEVVRADRWSRRWRTDRGVEVVVRTGPPAGAALALDAQLAGAQHVLRVEVAPSSLVERDGIEIAVTVPVTNPPTIGSLGYRALWASLADDLAARRSPALGLGLVLGAHRVAFAPG
jgi:hypothetical protein